jgi:hypothetical protein
MESDGSSPSVDIFRVTSVTIPCKRLRFSLDAHDILRQNGKTFVIGKIRNERRYLL